MNRKALLKIWNIARHEFIATVTRVGYLLVTLGVPVFMGGTMYVSVQMGMRSLMETKEIAAVIIDRAGLVNLDSVPDRLPVANASGDAFAALARKRVKFTRSEALDRTLVDVKDGRIAVCYVIESDYLKSGRVTSIISETAKTNDDAATAEKELATLLRSSLLAGHLTDLVRDRAIDPAQFQRREVTASGELKPESSRIQKILKRMAPLLLCVMMWMSIFMSASYLLQSLAQEKQNRVIEVILSSVRPTELLVGKILGLGAAGLIQASIYAVLLGLPLITQFAHSGWELAGLAVLFAALGYVLFAALMAGMGIIANTAQEANQLAAFWTLASGLPAFVLGVQGDLNSWMARLLSFFPPTASVTMLIRVSYASVAWWEVLFSILSLVVGIWLAIRYSVKIFRVASLLHGKRPTGAEIWRWMREA